MSKKEVLVNLPEELIKELDDLAEETESNRSDIIEVLLDYCLKHTDMIDEIFPYEEEEKEESEEENLIRLSEIFEVLKKDAFEVTDLLVTGINWYKDLALVLAFLTFPTLGALLSGINSGDLFNIVLFSLLLAFFIIGAPLFFYKNRKLKRKYKELIDIHQSLEEE